MLDIKGAGATPAENIKDPEGRGATFYGFSVHACLPSGETCQWSALPRTALRLLYFFVRFGILKHSIAPGKSCI